MKKYFSKTRKIKRWYFILICIAGILLPFWDIYAVIGFFGTTIIFSFGNKSWD